MKQASFFEENLFFNRSFNFFWIKFERLWVWKISLRLNSRENKQQITTKIISQKLFNPIQSRTPLHLFSWSTNNNGKKSCLYIMSLSIYIPWTAPFIVWQKCWTNLHKKLHPNLVYAYIFFFLHLMISSLCFLLAEYRTNSFVLSLRFFFLFSFFLASDIFLCFQCYKWSFNGFPSIVALPPSPC